MRGKLRWQEIALIYLYMVIAVATQQTETKLLHNHM